MTYACTVGDLVLKSSFATQKGWQQKGVFSKLLRFTKTLRKRVMITDL